MLKLKLNTTVYLPEWRLCNIPSNGNIISGPTKNVCRFCIKTKASSVCALFNKPLLRCGDEVHKTDECVRLCCKFTKEVNATTQGPLSP